jgi:hypothetical protein
MTRQIFLNAPEHVQWLKDTHLAGRVYPEFASFVLNGNEDAPVSVELYSSVNPNVTDTPILVSLED